MLTAYRDNFHNLQHLHPPYQYPLLAVLPAEELERLHPHLKWVPMPLGEIL